MFRNYTIEFDWTATIIIGKSRFITYTHARARMHVHTHTQTHVHAYMLTHTCTYKHVHTNYIHTYGHTSKQTHIRTTLHIRI